MKFGIIVGTDEAEVVWNAFRFGNASLKSDHQVKIFLINKGVEVESLKDQKYKVKEQIDSFITQGGEILACGTCLKSRNQEGSSICPVSTMADLLKLVEESDKILTFS